MKTEDIVNSLESLELAIFAIVDEIQKYSGFDLGEPLGIDAKKYRLDAAAEPDREAQRALLAKAEAIEDLINHSRLWNDRNREIRRKTEMKPD